MIELGKTKTIVVRERKDGKFVVHYDNDGRPKTRTAPECVTRITRDPLDGSFGKDRGRKLVVKLMAGDVLSLKPHKTQQEPLTARLSDIYRWIIHGRAQKAHMLKMVERKKKLAERREQRRRDDADRRFKRKIKSTNA